MTPQGSELDTGVSPSSQETNHNYPPALRPGKVYTISSRCVVMLIARYGPPLNPVLGPGGLVWSVCQRYRHQVGPHPVRDAWNDAELSSVAIEHCSAVGVKWGFIGLCRLGYREEDAPVTVLISLMDPMVRKPTAAVVEKHERVTHAIHGDLVRQGFTDVHVEIVAGIREPDAGPTIDAVPNAKHQVNDVLHPGSSIGVQCSRSSGCFSGLVQLTQDDGSSSVLGLTSHHVVSAGRTDKTASIRPDDGEPPVYVVSPAEPDCHEFIRQLRGELSVYEEYLATIEDPKPSSTVRQSELASMRGKVSSLRMHLDALEPLSREPQRLGRVLWSSAVDGWALMTLDNRSLIPSADSICDSTEDRAAKALKQVKWMLTPQDRARPLYKWDLKKPGILSLTTPDHEVVAPAAEVRQLCQSSPAAVVYIHSRASTLSKGVLHDAPSLSPGYSKDDVSQLTEVILTVAETFWPWAPGIPMTNSDAGAAVRLADGRLVGFVRENIDAGVPVTYISLAEPLLQSIVGATGARDASFISCWRDG